MIPTVRQGPAALNLEFYEADTQGIAIWLPMDLTGFTVRLQVRDISGTQLAELTVGDGLTVIPGDLPPPTPDNPNPTPPSSLITIAPTPAQRAAVVGKRAQYDLEVASAGYRETWLAGAFTVTSQVTI